MKVSVVIPNYNGEENLKANLAKVLAAGADEVIIVDDASTDGSVEEIQKLKVKNQNYNSKVKILENEKNMGFSSTVNRGVNEASGEIVVLLNTDVAPEQNFLQPLIDHFSNSQIFAVGCLDKSIENGKTILRGRGIGKWQKGFLMHERGEVDKTDTLWVSAGSGAFKKEIWEKLGGMDFLYNPFYWEDIDLSYRAEKSGYEIQFEPKSQVTHRHEEGIIKQSYSLFYIKSISYRNQFFFVWKNITDPGFLISHMIWLPYHFMRAFLTFDTAFIRGFFMAMVKLPVVIIHRYKVKSLFKLKDGELLR